MAILLVLLGNESRAQLSGSVSFVSDYRFRGVSLSGGRPEPQAHIGYDSSSDWYAGASTSRVALNENRSNAQLITYGGYSHRLPSGLSWEAGATKSIFQHAARSNYTEVFAGLASENFSGRIYFAPDYFGRGNRTLYAELNTNYPIQEQIHLLGHIGLLYSFLGNEEPAPSTTRADTRIGVSARLTDWQIQLAWVAVEKSRERYSRYENFSPHTVVLNASYSF